MKKLLLLITVLLLALSSIGQDVYSLSEKVGGIYLKGAVIAPKDEFVVFIVKLNPNKIYKLGFEGTDVSITYNGATFSGDFTVLLVQTTNIETELRVGIKSTSKKSKCAVVVTFIGSLE